MCVCLNLFVGKQPLYKGKYYAISVAWRLLRNNHRKFAVIVVKVVVGVVVEVINHG